MLHLSLYLLFPSLFVLSEQTAWFLIAQKHEEMTAWMTAINAQIYSLWLKNFTPPEDDYWGQGYAMGDG